MEKRPVRDRGGARERKAKGRLDFFRVFHYNESKSLRSRKLTGQVLAAWDALPGHGKDIKVKNKLLLLVKIVLILALVVGLAFVGMRQYEYHRGAQAYKEAEAIAGMSQTVRETPAPTPTPDSVPETEAAPTPTPGMSMEQLQEQLDAMVELLVDDEHAAILESVDLEALRETNEDVIGWILIPGADVSFPMVQGDDNAYYLNRTWNLTYNSVGAIFMECQNSPDLSDFNTIVYGHNMRNGSMFGQLKKYKDAQYWRERPYIYILTEEGVYRYDIFAAHEASVRSIVYGVGEFLPEMKEEYIRFSLENSSIDTGVIPTANDRMLTLSTCTGNGYATRWVVQGVLRGIMPLGNTVE